MLTSYLPLYGIFINTEISDGFCRMKSGSLCIVGTLWCLFATGCLFMMVAAYVW